MNEPDVHVIECPMEQSSSSSSANSQSTGSVSSQILLHTSKGEELGQVVKEEMGIEGDTQNETDVKEYFCGFGKCRPKWMQVFRDSKFFTFILCVNCCIEGALVSGKELPTIVYTIFSFQHCNSVDKDYGIRI